MKKSEFSSGAMPRRRFVGTLAAASAAAFFPGTVAAPAASQRKLRKAIMYSTVGMKGSVLERFRLIKDAGFEGVEPMGGMNRNEVLAAFKDTGLGAASVCDHLHWVKPFSSPDEADRKIGFDALVLSLNDAHAYGAGSVLLVPGVVSDGVSYSQCWERSIVEIKKAVPLAKELGVRISIENVGNHFITKPEQAIEYLDAINSEWVGWHFDIGNVGAINGPAERWIQVLGKRINRIHVKDFSASGGRPKLLDGDTNWPAVMGALDRAGYSGWGISEQPSDQASNVETARDLAQRMDKVFAL
ncbi:MAG TPA: sugar phosphate isomerase/epimerase family protein [Candidatus Angelobacter sp.]|nr:sugar phosphate isomerase/epimerase family protein [Candidatus Angelobacter sp.]